ncbi:MAG: hypothetical protein JW839_08590 [Candidatus Lokiarchaeota archaeon]|nr:hypothetical protein [Candidatus Lokiarchaeota archaeon]
MDDLPHAFIRVDVAMRPGFFDFDDEPKQTIVLDVARPKNFLKDPRDLGGVLVESKAVDKAKCSICDKSLRLELFYFEGKTRRFIRCEGCNKYLFEIEKKRK